MEEIRGYVSNIRYYNEDNGYAVFDIVCDNEEQVAVGNINGLDTGMSLKLTGDFVVHKTYGDQFSFKSYEEVTPEDSLEMERYLGSGAVKGIGIALAARIVRKFGDDTFRIIEEEPERLAEIKGISEKKAMDIASQMEEKKDQRQAMMYLQKYGISMNLSVKIYQKYGLNMYRVLEENPYRLADEIEGVGFKTADEIAQKIGILPDSDYRIRSGILYTLMQASAYGHSYLPEEDFLQMAEEILSVPRESIGAQIENLAIERRIFVKNSNNVRQIYSARFYYMELHIAAMLRELNLVYHPEINELNRCIDRIEKEEGFPLDEIQREALITAARNGLLVLTGGPGTGKTTTINAMIKYFEMENLDIMLAAPTGRAAKRMSELTGFEARTIHRLLEVNGGAEGDGSFNRNMDNPLETDVIIIDEMSMVDLPLFHALLRAISPGTRLVLVGDADQLPSVGPGTVLHDLIGSKCIPTIELKKIFRQNDQSNIVINAHKINKGERVELDNKNNDFFFLKRYDSDQCINVTLQLILEKLPSYVDASPMDMQVMTPTRKGKLGVENLNKVLQHYLNPKDPKKIEREVGEGLFREGDKVMQTKNNYQLEWEVTNRFNIVLDHGMGVFNGDTGIIKRIDTYLEQVEVEFDESRKVYYSFGQLDELELAYAVTVHKSQGSEYPAVVIPLMMGPRPLMNRNLLYTAVTRAKKCVTIVGDENVFNEMINNGNSAKRYSGLAERIVEEWKEDSDWS